MDMKTTSAGKSLKTFSCAEIRDKKAIGESTVMLSGAFAIKNLEAPNFCHFSVLNGHWFIHLPWMRARNTSTSKLLAKIVFESTMLLAYNRMDKVCEEVV